MNKDHYAELAWLIGSFLTIISFALNLEGYIDIITVTFVAVASIGNIILIKLTN